jgi:hypothetical protein
MDTLSECHRLFPRLSHLPAFSLDGLPFTKEQLIEAGLLDEGESLGHLRVYPTFTISLIGASEYVPQILRTMSEHPELLGGESLSFLPHLYTHLSLGHV